MKDPKTLLRVSIIGTTLVALCCFTPVLVILLGVVGLSALTGYLDYVLLPALASAYRRHWQRRGRDGGGAEGRRARRARSR
jgi:hypothetical protein